MIVKLVHLKVRANLLTLFGTRAEHLSNQAFSINQRGL